MRRADLTTFMCRLSGSYGSLNLSKAEGPCLIFTYKFFRLKLSLHHACYVSNPSIPSYEITRTSFTISEYKTATHFRPCQSQRTATSIGNKPHSPTAGTSSSPPRHNLLFLGVSNRMLQNVPRSTPSKLLPTHNLRPPYFISSDTAVPSEKLIVAQTFKKLPTPLWNPKFHHRAYKTPSLHSEPNKSNLQP